jgi:pyruvate,water dikinase
MADLAKLVADAPSPPQTLDDIRALGPAARDALDDFLDEYGWRIITGYDLEHRCLIELPDATVRAITAAATHIGRLAVEPNDALADTLRVRVPEGDRGLFDELVEEARTVYGLRDDNGPVTIERPIGLLRRAILEVGDRLVARDALDDREDAVELDVDELIGLLTDGRGPSASEIRARRERRQELASFEPPHTLGPPEPPPPLDAFPDALRRVTEIAMAATSQLEAPAEREALVGLGIGTEVYVGTARVGVDAEDVLARMEPGDVLIAPFTNPAYNVVLSMAGAVVCQQGGPLSHAAVMAREFGFPAVVGALDAMTAIKDGDTVEVDPTTGRVRVL